MIQALYQALQMSVSLGKCETHSIKEKHKQQICAYRDLSDVKLSASQEAEALRVAACLFTAYSSTTNTHKLFPRSFWCQSNYESFD